MHLLVSRDECNRHLKCAEGFPWELVSREVEEVEEVEEGSHQVFVIL